MRRTLAMIFPEVEVRLYTYLDICEAERQPALRQSLAAADLLFTLEWDDGYGDFAADRIGGLTRRAIIVPHFDFPAFHPDMTTMPLKSGGLLPSPVGDYQSVICLAGYLAGLDEQRTQRMFNALAYRRLGYLDLFEMSCRGIADRFARRGYDIEPAVRRWGARGAFMFTVNHPRAYVIADLTKLVCRTHGVGDVHDIDYADFFPDELAQSAIYPVFPEIARAFGLAGSYLFKPPLRHDRDALLDLGQFVRGCFAGYRRTDVADWALHDRIPPAAALLREMAG